MNYLVAFIGTAGVLASAVVGTATGNWWWLLGTAGSLILLWIVILHFQFMVDEEKDKATYTEIST